jgi:PAS domain S-box-containing protein
MMKKKLKRSKMEEGKGVLNEAESLARMGSWKWTERNNELVWSDGLREIFDKKPGEIIFWSTFLENVFPEDALRVKDFFHDVKDRTTGSAIEYRIVKEGHVRHLSFTAKPRNLPDINILGAVVDVTERKEYAEELEHYTHSQRKTISELDKTEKKYRTLFERSIDPIFLATDKLELVDVNPSFLKFLEYSTIEDASVNLNHIFARKDDVEYFRDTLRDYGQIRNFEVLVITKTGVEKTCLLNCVFVPDQAPEYCYQGIVHDLTLRKQAENDMLAAERFALTGKLARTIAHEVRNPLTNLGLALDQLREEIPVGNQVAKLYGDIIERNANRIEQLVGEMLNSSRPEKLDLELTSVNRLIEDTLKLAADRLELNKIQLLTSYQETAQRILVDKAKMKIALLNIIINAIEAMVPGKGVLRIETAITDKLIVLSISDNGKGIPDSDLGKLFEPFFTSKFSGMGLGLTSAKNILDSHGVHTVVKSQLNMGTTFCINFKLAV